jgi:hypothetical protein
LKHSTQLVNGELVISLGLVSKPISREEGGVSRAEIAEAAEMKVADTFLSLCASDESLLTSGDSPLTS